MPETFLRRPDPSEHADYYHGYVGCVAGDNIIVQNSLQISDVIYAIEFDVDRASGY